VERGDTVSAKRKVRKVYKDFRQELDVIFTLAQKDFKVRYKNSILGFLWSLLNPLAYMVIISLVFSLMLHLTVPNYASWLLLGILIWRFFSVGTNQGLNSLISEPSLVTKVRLPRFIIVLSNNLANLFGSALEFVVLLPLLLYLGVSLTVYALLLPIVLIVELILVFGLSLSLSALTVRYRDFYQLWDIALQLGFFLSPIVYDASLIPQRYQWIYSLNPVTGLIILARGVFLLRPLPTLSDFAIMCATICVLFLVGAIVFSRLEKRFPEMI
jgi:lipopolysaccharide transport system permease protein